MKKLWVKIVLLSLLIIVSVGTLNFMYVHTNYWKATNAEVIKFNNVPQHIQIANLGSSHGLNSFDYKHFPCRGFNFGISSQMYPYDLSILQQYINHFDKNAIVLIPVSYFQISRIKTDFKDIRGKYYRFLDKEYMQEYYSVREKILFSLAPVLTAGNVVTAIFNDIPSRPDIPVMSESELLTYSIEKHKIWTTNSNYEVEAGEEGITHNKYWASRIIDFCYAHDLQPVLVTTPITSVLNAVYREKTPDFFNSFYRFTDELLQSYPSLRYFDYSHDPRFENDFSLFADGDHLNAVGAEKFTAIVMADLQNNGIIIPNN